MSVDAEVEVRPTKQILRAGRDLKSILEQFPQKYWDDIFEVAGVADKIAETVGKTLDEAEEDDHESLGKLSIAAMKKGMTGVAPNAQMVRTFHAWQELQLGREQLRSVEIHNVPATIPDNMSEEIAEILRELTRLAQSKL